MQIREFTQEDEEKLKQWYGARKSYQNCFRDAKNFLTDYAGTRHSALGSDENLPYGSRFAYAVADCVQKMADADKLVDTDLIDALRTVRRDVYEHNAHQNNGTIESYGIVMERDDYYGRIEAAKHAKAEAQDRAEKKSQAAKMKDVDVSNRHLTDKDKVDILSIVRCSQKRGYYGTGMKNDILTFAGSRVACLGSKENMPYGYDFPLEVADFLEKTFLNDKAYNGSADLLQEVKKTVTALRRDVKEQQKARETGTFKSHGQVIFKQNIVPASAVFNAVKPKAEVEAEAEAEKIFTFKDKEQISAVLKKTDAIAKGTEKAYESGVQSLVLKMVGEENPKGIVENLPYVFEVVSYLTVQKEKGFQICNMDNYLAIVAKNAVKRVIKDETEAGKSIANQDLLGRLQNFVNTERGAR